MMAIEIPSLSRQNLAVPGAALAFGGLAAALFLWPIHGPSVMLATSALQPPVQAVSNPFREVRRISLIPDPARESRVAPSTDHVELAEPVAPAEPVVTGAPAIASAPARDTMKRAATSPRSAMIRRPVESRFAGKDRAAAKVQVKVAGRAAVPEQAPGIVARTIDAGSRAATFVAGGVKGTRDTVFGLGRTVAGFVTDSL